MIDVVCLFVRFLRLRGLRVSVGEATDAARAAAVIGVADRDRLRDALAVTLVKDDRHRKAFDETFDAFFTLVSPLPDEGGGHGHDHAHADTDSIDAQRTTVSEDVSRTPKQTHAHGETDDVRDYFDQRDLASAYQAHQEGNKRDLTSLSEELLLAEARDSTLVTRSRHRLEVNHLRGAQTVGGLTGASTPGMYVDVDLTVADDDIADRDDEPGTAAPVDATLDAPPDLQAMLERCLQQLLESGRAKAGEVTVAQPGTLDEDERAEMEETLRRLTKTMRGALTRRRSTIRKGRVDVGRTMRRNLRYDGIPFRPVWHDRQESNPKLVVLADVSLSVRNTARFTLHAVHGLQSLFAHVRTFAFVDEMVEITNHFHEHPVEEALGVVFGGEVLNPDGNSNYGLALGSLISEHGDALTRRTTVLILGDGRGNGNPPNVEALEQIRRQCRRLVWICPEPRSYWRYAGCDMPKYAPVCHDVAYARNIAQLGAVAERLLLPAMS